MKRFLSLLLVLTLVFTIAACSNEKNISTDIKQHETQDKNENTDIISIESSESEIVTEKSSTDTESESKNMIENSSTGAESEEKIPAETPKQEPTSNNNQTNSVVNNSTSNTTNKFSPKVIASRCEHNYLPPTCTSLIPCTICGELLTGLYQGDVIKYGHGYRNNKCIGCGFERKGVVELDGIFYAINQPITIDIRLMTSKQEIDIYPCVALYKNINGKLEPYNGLYDVGEFFALEATCGELLVSNGVQYGRWDYMTNSILKTNPNAIIETDFAPSRLIRRFKLSIPEAGQYEIILTDGPDSSKISPDEDCLYILNVY